jgi:hypothetical protein
MSAISKHTPACVSTWGRTSHMQWLGTSRQPAQRSPLMPPRAMKGLALRAKREARSLETACGMDGMSIQRVNTDQPACKLPLSFS